MKVVASQGKSRYLIVRNDDAGREPNKNTQAQVLDLAQNRLFPRSLLLSLLARGPWEPSAMSEEELTGLLAQVFHVGQSTAA